MRKMRIFYIFVLLLVLAGPLWSWMFPPLLSEKKELVPPALPLWSEPLKSDVREQILAHNLWQQHRGSEKSQKALAHDKTAPIHVWVLVAVGQAKNEKMAMIRVKSKIEIYYEGDVLPDGRKLLKILLDGVLVNDEGEKTSDEYVYLFGKGS